MSSAARHQRWFLIIVSVITAMGGLLFGYDTGVISGAILYIKKELAISTSQEASIISMLPLGAICGALIGGPLSDRFGRKKIVLMSSLLFIFNAIGLVLSHAVYEIIFWRLIVGIAIGMSSTTAPIYIAEISPQSIRGALVTLNQLAITVGILLSYLISLLFVETHSWRTMFAFSAIPATLQFFSMIFFPESPRYLTKVGEIQQACEVFSQCHISEREKERELDYMAHHTLAHAPEKKRWRALLSPKIAPILLAGFGITFIQQVTGINAVIYYAPTIFQFAGLTSERSALLATISMGTINVLMTLVALYLIDKVGRKPLLQCGLAGMVISLIALGLGFSIYAQYAKIIGVVALFVYVGCFAYSLGPGSWLINSEIYPIDIRGIAMGAATCVNWLSNFLVTSTFLDLITSVGRAATFWTYAAMGIIGMLFIWKRIPETRSKSLEEIEEYWQR